jgi:hypothetical protein
VVQEALLDVGQRHQCHRAEHLLALRHVAPAEHLETAPLGLRIEERLDLVRLAGVGGQEGHRDAARVRGVALEMPVGLEELPRHGRQDARAIAWDRVAAAAATVLHAAQRDQRAGHDVVPPPALLVSEESHAARVAVSDQRRGAWVRRANLSAADATDVGLLAGLLSEGGHRGSCGSPAL